jgi:predicted RND superfamily exporter protein
MSTTTEEVEERLATLFDLREQEKLLEEYLRERCTDEYAKLDEISQQIQKLQEEAESVNLSITEKESETHEDLLTAKKMIDQAQDSLKKACYELPDETLKKGTRFTHKSLRVTVTKANIVNEYRSEALLDAHPELEEIYIDGDPVVGRTINAEMLDRVIAEGAFSEEDAAPYRFTKKIRNSQVRIKEIVDAQE